MLEKRDDDGEEFVEDGVKTGTKETMVKVLRNVVGVKGCSNDVIVCYGERIARHVMFFPGDVQNYYENMAKHRDNHKWKGYNLEDTARLLFDRFSDACVWVIRANKLHLNTFACYNNFVQSNMFGVPRYSNDVKALLQASSLLSNCIEQEFTTDIRENVMQKSVSIVGFSKGCMVLNQMLYGWPSLPSTDNHSLHLFIKRLKEFHFLDSGNCGHSGAWVVDGTCLNEVSKTVKFRVYVTPYQVNDTFRPWISEELKIFKKTLKSLDANLKERLFFEEEEPSLENHFRLLSEFRRPSQT